MSDSKECNCGRIGVVVIKKQGSPSYSRRPDLLDEPSEPLEVACPKCQKRLDNSIKSVKGN